MFVLLLLDSSLIPLCNHHDEINHGNWKNPKEALFQYDLKTFPAVVIYGSVVRFGKLRKEGNTITWYGDTEFYKEDVSFQLSVTTRTIMEHYEVDRIVQKHPSIMLQEKEWQNVKVIGSMEWLGSWKSPMVRYCGNHTASLLQLIANPWEFHQKNTLSRELMIGDVKVKIKWNGDYVDSVSLKKGFLPISFESALWDSAAPC